eukprot:CAMPEP_0174876634 /NCGR_PEP_ID=MMETSP1114-20130205/80463_1 /TAXON_ID=312471 /ORGANISM="Neobodo designis, Strain CCAP 1951/1" /LENGTH=72 /DNA_ID=CAMNT_0016112009 /DNA_START=67 /DNA_END=281 /DNA_ORIENTATION=-
MHRVVVGFKWPSSGAVYLVAMDHSVGVSRCVWIRTRNCGLAALGREVLGVPPSKLAAVDLCAFGSLRWNGRA